MLGGLGRNVEKASMTIEYIILVVCSILMYTAIAQTQRSKKKRNSARTLVFAVLTLVML